MANNKGKDREAKEPQAETEEKEGTIEELLADLPLSDKGKKMVTALLTGFATSLTQINNRLETLETKGDSTDSSLFEGLTPEQKYYVLMAKFSAPAQAQQTQMWQTLMGAARGGGGGSSEIEQLASSAEKMKTLRDILSPAPTAVQIAMERAQITQVIAQTRLMNRVAGKQTNEYLDKLEKELTGGSEGEE